MRGFVHWISAIGLLLGFAANASAQSSNTTPSSLWRTMAVKSGAEEARGAARLTLAPDRYAQFALDEAAMRDALASGGLTLAQARPSASATPPVASSAIPVPLPNGEMIALLLEESQTMAPELATKFPQIKTYRVVSGSDERVLTGVADFTGQGFHAMLNTTLGVVFIDPRTDSSGLRSYISYFKHDYNPTDKERSMPKWGLSDVIKLRAQNPALAARRLARPVSGTERITYRLAVATTKEYTDYQGGVEKTMDAVVHTVNVVNLIYERDLSVHMTLVANNDKLFSTNSDTYKNKDADQRLDANQGIVDTIIGTANYDIGHVFATAGAGLAAQGVCDPAQKAQGTTGIAKPVGDPFDIDYVAHEMGHQLGASHTYNLKESFCDTREADSAYEPGSGSTIMSYVGICTNSNLQQHADAMFHAGSIDEIRTTIDNKAGKNYCGTRTALNNAVPTANAGPAYTIPAKTAFALTGTGSDANGDTLSYTWDEMDLGKQSTSNLDMDDEGTQPLFRSFMPSASPTRFFPRLADLLANTSDFGNHLPDLTWICEWSIDDDTPKTCDTGERLPKTSRPLKFRFTVRDQRGGVADSDVTLTVVGSAGPFAVATPNGAESLGSSTTVKWNVAGTASAPISCANVDLLLSNDGGNSFTTTLASKVPNSGSAAITFPKGTSSKARVKVQCNGNIFFALSQADFSYASQGVPVVCTLAVTSNALSVGSGLTAGSFNVTTPAGCSFTSTASSTASWLSLKSVSPQTGSGAVQFAVAANTGSAARSGTITLTSSAGSQVVTVSQLGVAPTATACSYTFDDADGYVSVGAKAYGGRVGVVTGSTCSWTVVSNVSWITVTGGARAIGSDTVLFNVADNTTTSPRTGTITVAGKAYLVYQAAATASCSYVLGSGEVSLDDKVVATDSTGGYGTVTVATSSTCSWTAVSQVSWITVNSGASGRGNGTVAVTIAANTGSASRTGEITIADKTYTVNQSGTAANCAYFVATTDATVTGRYVLIGSSVAGTGSVVVSTNPGCRWSASSAVSWLSFGVGSGTGSSRLSVSLSANTGSTPRSGTATIAGQTFVVTQAGTGTVCSYDLDTSVSSTSDQATSTVTIGPEAVYGNIYITTSPTCAWTASSAASWLTISSGSSGTGVGTVMVYAAANTSAAERLASITVAGQTFSVRQAAAGSKISTAGNDTLTGTSGGINSVTFSGLLANYVVVADGTGKFTVQDSVGSDGRDTLSNIQRARFADKSLAFDTSGSNSAGGIYRIYAAAFNRTPDLAGLGYWIDRADKGASALDIATGFTYSTEFQTLFAATITDSYATGVNVTDLVTGFYTNVLHRTPDAAGRDWYADQITTRQKTVGQVLAEISDSDENKAQLAAVIANGIVFAPWGG